MSVRENLIAARAVYAANVGRWTFHQAVDYSSGEETDDDYAEMMDALKSALPQVPVVATNIVRWSHSAGTEAILALFDRAIASTGEPS